jgi:hypothetical protein
LFFMLQPNLSSMLLNYQSFPLDSIDLYLHLIRESRIAKRSIISIQTKSVF